MILTFSFRGYPPPLPLKVASAFVVCEIQRLLFFFFFWNIFLIFKLTPQQQSAESRNSAGAEALAVARRPKEETREKTRPPPVSRGSSLWVCRALCAVYCLSRLVVVVCLDDVKLNNHLCGKTKHEALPRR